MWRLFWIIESVAFKNVWNERKIEFSWNNWNWLSIDDWKQWLLRIEFVFISVRIVIVVRRVICNRQEIEINSSLSILNNDDVKTSYDNCKRIRTQNSFDKIWIEFDCESCCYDI